MHTPEVMWLKPQSIAGPNHSLRAEWVEFQCGDSNSEPDYRSTSRLRFKPLSNSNLLKAYM